MQWRPPKNLKKFQGAVGCLLQCLSFINFCHGTAKSPEIVDAKSVVPEDPPKNKNPPIILTSPGISSVNEMVMAPI